MWLCCIGLLAQHTERLDSWRERLGSAGRLHTRWWCGWALLRQMRPGRARLSGLHSLWSAELCVQQVEEERAQQQCVHKHNGRNVPAQQAGTRNVNGVNDTAQCCPSHTQHRRELVMPELYEVFPAASCLHVHPLIRPTMQRSPPVSQYFVYHAAPRAAFLLLFSRAYSGVKACLLRWWARQPPTAAFRTIRWFLLKEQ